MPRAQQTGAAVPALSVVLCTLDGSATIVDQLTALSEQRTVHAFEVVVVDNGSTDDTAAIVAECSGADSRFRLVAAPERANLSYARNTGVAAARGAFVAFCDDDDLVAETWVDGLLAALEQAPFVASSLEYERLNPDEARTGASRFQSSRVERMFGLPVTNGAIAIDRVLWDRVGGNDESFGATGEDFDFALRVVRETGVEPMLAADAIYHYRMRSEQRAVFRQWRRFGESHAQLYARHGRGSIDRSTRARDAARSWWWIGTRVPTLIAPSRRRNWLRHFGRRLGRLIGSLRYRVFYL